MKQVDLSQCAEHDIRAYGIPVGTVKKLATGKGNAKKAQMVAAAKRAFKHKQSFGEDESDALWILATGYLQATGKRLTPDGAGEEQEVFAL